MNNTVENDFLGFPNVKWLHLTGEVSTAPEMCGLRTRPRTDVDPPSRFFSWPRSDMPSSNWHRRRGRIVSPLPGAMRC